MYKNGRDGCAFYCIDKYGSNITIRLTHLTGRATSDADASACTEA